MLSNHSVFCVNICAAAFLNVLLCLSQTVCEMTVSLSLAESHLGFKLLVVPRSLFPPWSVSGVGVQLFHRHDKWFRNLPHCSLTNHKHTRMLSTSIFHPVVFTLPAPVVLARRAAARDWGRFSRWEPLAIGVGRQPVYGLGHISFWKDLKKPICCGPLVLSSKCINTQLSVATLFANFSYFAWTHWSLEVAYHCMCMGACVRVSVWVRTIP